MMCELVFDAWLNIDSGSLFFSPSPLLSASKLNSTSVISNTQGFQNYKTMNTLETNTYYDKGDDNLIQTWSVKMDFKCTR